MSQGPETTFIGSIHRHLPVGLYRMKNHNQFNGGIADCWYSGKRDLWVEYKFLVVPKRDATQIDLRHPNGKMLSPLQQDWLRERHLEGRNIAVIVGCKEGGAIFQNLEWEVPLTTKQFRERLVSRKDVAAWITDTTNGRELR